MEYKGKLYGKFGRKYVPLQGENNNQLTAAEVDRWKAAAQSSRNSKTGIQKDIDFLKEMKSEIEKMGKSNSHLATMVSDWLSELEHSLSKKI